MADEVLLASTGYVYTAPSGTPMPTLPIADPKNPGSDWTSIGNTSLDNGISRDVSGDDPTVLGSWQNPSLVTTKPVKTRSISINLQDFTVASYALYYGGGLVVGPDGVTPATETDTIRAFKIPDSPDNQELALLIIAVDGTYQVVEHYARASFIGSDSAVSDPTTLSELPVTATTLGTNGYTGTISERIQYAGV